jgi:hypothetical protein
MFDYVLILDMNTVSRREEVDGAEIQVRKNVVF